LHRSFLIKPAGHSSGVDDEMGMAFAFSSMSKNYRQACYRRGLSG